MTRTRLKIQSYGANFNAPHGFMLNGKLSVTVASNNLTVAIKTLAGNDPSAADPVIVRIGGVVRVITAATTDVNVAGGTADYNSGNAGSAELSGKEIDWFAYLIWDASASVTRLGISRIPYAGQTSEFSSADTNEKAILVNADVETVGTNPVVNIGRFAAILTNNSGTYNWSVPTFTAINLIQRPIFNTRWLSFAPTLTGGTSSSAIGPVYQLIDKTCTVQCKQLGNASNATSKSFVVPFALCAGTAQYSAAIINATDNGTNLSTLAHLEMTDTSATVQAFKTFYEALWTASGNCNLYIPNLSYRIA